MPNKPKVIVFDIGGVLLNWKILIPTIAQTLKISPDQFHEELKNNLSDLELGKRHQDEFWKYLCEKYDYKGDFIDLKTTWIEKQPIIKSGWELLKKVKENGYRVTCCTNNWIGTVERQIQILPDFLIFEDIINSAYEGVKKPDAEIYKIVEDKTGEKGENLLLIDDLKENCDGAEKLGWQVFQYDYITNDGENSAVEISQILDIN